MLYPIGSYGTDDNPALQRGPQKITRLTDPHAIRNLSNQEVLSLGPHQIHLISADQLKFLANSNADQQLGYSGLQDLDVGEVKKIPTTIAVKLLQTIEPVVLEKWGPHLEKEQVKGVLAGMLRLTANEPGELQKIKPEMLTTLGYQFGHNWKNFFTVWELLEFSSLANILPPEPPHTPPVSASFADQDLDLKHNDSDSEDNVSARKDRVSKNPQAIKKPTHALLSAPPSPSFGPTGEPINTPPTLPPVPPPKPKNSQQTVINLTDRTAIRNISSPQEIQWLRPNQMKHITSEQFANLDDTQLKFRELEELDKEEVQKIVLTIELFQKIDLELVKKWSAVFMRSQIIKLALTINQLQDGPNGLPFNLKKELHDKFNTDWEKYLTNELLFNVLDKLKYKTPTSLPPTLPKRITPFYPQKNISLITVLAILAITGLGMAVTLTYNFSTNCSLFYLSPTDSVCFILLGFVQAAGLSYYLKRKCLN